MSSTQSQQQRLMRPNQTSAYFQGCPLSKFITMAVIFSHIVLEKGGFAGGSDLLSLNLEDVMIHGEIHRLFLHPLTFSSMGELVTGLLVLVPFMRQFEREMGTKKFGSFLLVKCLLLSTIFQLLCLLCLESTFSSSSNQYRFDLSPGPYSFIGSLLFLYHVYTPRLYPKFIGILGFDLSEKSINYGFTFVTVYSQGLSSIIPTLSGFIASWISISQSNFYGSWECVLPSFVYNIAISVGKIFGLDQLITTNIYLSRSGINAAIMRHHDNHRQLHRHAPPPRGFGGARGGGGFAAAAQQPQFQPMPPSAPPSEEAIEQLTAMGFERDAVIRALGATDNNVEAAANRLLSGI